MDTVAFLDQTDEERERPPYWRFWRVVPARGRIGILFGSWYSDPIRRRVHGMTKSVTFDSALNRIEFFERMLAEDGAVIIKLWFHLSKKAQHKLLKDLETDPENHWRVLPEDLVWAAHLKKISTVIPLEGWDAGGKGSAIRRVTAAMDPRFYRIIPVAAPTDEERAHHYLWRF